MCWLLERSISSGLAHITHPRYMQSPSHGSYLLAVHWLAREGGHVLALLRRSKQPRVGLKGKTRKPKGGCNAGRRS